MNPNDHNWMIYSIGDDHYIIPAIVALTSIRRFHPKAHYCVLADSEKIGAEKQRLLERMQIELVDCKAGRFPYQGSWPAEAFLKLEGPEIFFRRGFPYSMFVEGDTLCLQALELERIAGGMEGYAGIKRPGHLRANFIEPEFISRKYGLSEAAMDGANTNAGVLFWNNSQWVKTGFLDRCVQCYQECGRFFKAADQSLFSLVSLLPPALPWMVLEQGYNYLCHVPEVEALGVPRETVRVVHYSRKPWGRVRFVELKRNPLLLAFRAEWRAWVRELGCFDPDLRWRGSHSSRFARSLRFKLSELREGRI